MSTSTKSKHMPSWGRLNDRIRSCRSFGEALSGVETLLPFGNGRSYGDSCHNDIGVLIDNRSRNNILAFDLSNGTLKAEAGILLSDILNFLTDTGWFLPVVPGTKFITLGGAIANDIHGKNHEKRGTFGRHVNSLVLWRSDGTHHNCSPTENTNLYSATIAGMGLTGIITSAEIQLIKVPSHFVLQTTKPFSNLDEYFDLIEAEEGGNEYSVSWVDSMAGEAAFGRGIHMTGQHIEAQKRVQYGEPKLTVPFTPPIPLVSGLPLRLFNQTYFWKNKHTKNSSISPPDSFFFPLDAIGQWNRLYGPKGLYQHQSVLPLGTAKEGIKELMRAAKLSGEGSFLTVLKRFGDLPSPGLLSFPMPGFTLTLDFANKGQTTLNLLNKLDEITLEAGGRINPYKDARMSSRTFQTAFSNWDELEELRDPKINSDFWRRTTKRRFLKPAPLAAGPYRNSINQTDKPEIQEL